MNRGAEDTMARMLDESRTSNDLKSSHHSILLAVHHLCSDTAGILGGTTYQDKAGVS
jgi:hypothetical protein